MNGNRLVAFSGSFIPRRSLLHVIGVAVLLLGLLASHSLLSSAGNFSQSTDPVMSGTTVELTETILHEDDGAAGSCGEVHAVAASDCFVVQPVTTLVPVDPAHRTIAAVFAPQTAQLQDHVALGVVAPKPSLHALSINRT